MLEDLLDLFNQTTLFQAVSGRSSRISWTRLRARTLASFARGSIVHETCAAFWFSELSPHLDGEGPCTIQISTVVAFWMHDAILVSLSSTDDVLEVEAGVPNPVIAGSGSFTVSLVLLNANFALDHSCDLKLPISASP